MTNHVLFFFFPSTSLIYHLMEAITRPILNFQEHRHRHDIVKGVEGD